MAAPARDALIARKNQDWLASLDVCLCCGEVLTPPVPRPPCLDRMGQDPVCRSGDTAYAFLRCPHQWHAVGGTPYQWRHYLPGTGAGLEQCIYCGMLKEQEA